MWYEHGAVYYKGAKYGAIPNCYQLQLPLLLFIATWGKKLSKLAKGQND